MLTKPSNRNTNRSFATAVVLASSLALTGCAPSLPDASGLMGDMMGDTLGDVGGMVGDVLGALAPADVMFAQMMIPHHQQAVEMSKLAETHASSPEVKALAARIKTEQGPEIAQMKDWLKSSGASEQMDHEMPMQGMLTEGQMGQLAAATGPAFDKMFLSFMILHHQGAVLMAKVVENSSNAEVSKLAKSIIDSQNNQIEEMNELLGK